MKDGKLKRALTNIQVAVLVTMTYAVWVTIIFNHMLDRWVDDLIGRLFASALIAALPTFITIILGLMIYEAYEATMRGK